ncbi:SDR family NAD(P)-dependent oxidoreductase [Granulicella mallensis]|uniref:NAD(P)-dependent dehydrogenase (Short-subunit alcohol dehydrogenase family) n=1 Tax=Granulicella mallensis TaxID=940614 RepID=A0A7W7ZRB3_9BACT|nr:SDR family oxidoreductase [Granulicella mallensis]MBB5064701.1 NAD(P)-dependent dehydrogenase (short-subunit alcohol dehydrogenase family) [Granulicella mallensis]
MDLQLTGKTAIVTGGSAGIGLATVKALTAEGVTVTVPGRTQAKLTQALAGIPRVVPVVADVATAEGAAALLQQVPDTDILINNLGIYEPKEFVDITDGDWLRLFETNVLSGVRLSRHYFPRMIERNSGRVIFISSESGVMTPPEMVHYGVTKSAQLAISRGLAERTKGTAVTVNTVLPGPTRSEGIVEFLEKMSSIPNATPEQAEREFFEKHRQSSLLQRLIEDSEIANLVAFLASPLSAATNGAAVRAEGGLLRSII